MSFILYARLVGLFTCIKETKVWICDLEDTANKVLGNTLKWKRIVDRFDAEYIPYVTEFSVSVCYADSTTTRICNIGTKFYFRTNHNADKYKIIMIDIAAASYEATVVIPEDPDAVLHNCVLFNNDLLAIVRTRKVRRMPSFPCIQVKI